jgi:hypothetical protein
MNLSRLRPTRMTLMALLGLLWAVSFGALRDFVWADIRSGLIDLRGLSRATRALIWLGLLLILLMVGALLFNDVWRDLFPLIAQVNGIPGRGALLPVALLPLSLFMLSIAWAFLLTGALHTHWLARLGILIFYMLVTSIRVVALVSTQLVNGYFGDLSMWACVVALLAVPVFFFVRRRSLAHPIVDFTVLLILIALIYIVSQSSGVASWHAFGIPVTLAEIEADIQFPSLVIMPLLLFFGVDVANFTRRAAGWVVDIVTLRMAQWATWIILIGAFLWRWVTLAQETAERFNAAPFSDVWPGYLGALGAPIIAGACLWLGQRMGQRMSQRMGQRIGHRTGAGQSPSAQASAMGPQTSPPAPRAEEPEDALTPEGLDGAVERLALPLIALYYVGSLLVTLILGQTVMDVGGLLISVGSLGAALFFWRRGKRAGAFYLAVFGALSIWRELLKPGAPLGILGVSTGNMAQVDFWWMVTLTAVALIWLARKRLTPERGARLLLLILITALLRQTSFIESPFSPFLAFAGIGFIAFGIVWDVATKGFWTNRDTPGLPRISRLFLYLGYMLLTVTMINWALTSHNLETLGQFTGNVTDAGFGRFGKPFLYAIIATTLALPAKRESADANS